MRVTLFGVAAAALLLAGGSAVMSWIWAEEPPPPEPGPPPTGRFAEDRAAPRARPVPFDGKRALGYLKELCDLGPRVSGSDAMRRQQQLLERHFAGLGGRVEYQRFNARQPSRTGAVEMANVVVHWHPDRRRRVILCGHYDTRPMADEEPNPRDRVKPFASANDGTSTVAWLMEAAHHVPGLPLNVGVDFVIFDGEEYVFEKRRDEYFLGSKHFSRQYASRQADPGRPLYLAAVLLDLFAAGEAVYPIDPASELYAGEVVRQIWATAAELGEKRFVTEPGREVSDDHIPLNQIAGIPAIDIIDFDYRHWHRLSDTPDKCSPGAMESVARVVLTWLQRIG